MAVRGWGGTVATAIGVAAGAGAAQLGLGYGLGVIAWVPSTNAASEAAWVASLAWATWIATTTTVAGAVCAARLAGAGANEETADGTTSPALMSGLWRITLAFASAAGALLTVALVAVPARATTRGDTLSPQTTAAGYTVIGVLIGLVAAIWALSSPAVATNIIATVVWLWVLAVVAVVDGVLSSSRVTSAQLGVWQITADSDRYWFRSYFYWPGAAMSLGSALAIGSFAARSAARGSAAQVGVTISGGAGPLLVAVVYFLVPRPVGIRAEQLSAHLVAPYAVIAGIAGSVLVMAIAQRAHRRTAGADSPVAGQPPSEIAPASNRATPPNSDLSPTGAADSGNGPDAAGTARIPAQSRGGDPADRR